MEDIPSIVKGSAGLGAGGASLMADEALAEAHASLDGYGR
jgi:hypothetical protein